MDPRAGPAGGADRDLRLAGAGRGAGAARGRTRPPQRDLDRQTEDSKPTAPSGTPAGRRWRRRRRSSARPRRRCRRGSREAEPRIRGELTALREQFARECEDRRDRLVAERRGTRPRPGRHGSPPNTRPPPRGREPTSPHRARQTEAECAPTASPGRRTTEGSPAAGPWLDAELTSARRPGDRRTGRAWTAQRAAFAADQELLARGRETFEAERAAESRPPRRPRELADARESDLTRREATLQTDRATFDHDRTRLNDDLLRLDRRRGELEAATRP